ncbi:helix-turn-helix domain-containing protein [Saccharolobus sp.]|uniref:winged helix-turn-helix transcriptional regulator n=1 Tax=Saccharolobus sp. TaxID=2100761 RepID=UPI003180D12E
MIKYSKANKRKQSCPLIGTINVISRKWFLLVLNVIGNEEKIGFNGILNMINGISPKALSDVLKLMEGMELIKKNLINSSPPRVEYSLTNKGKKLRKSIIPLLKWAADYTGHYDCPILRTK